MSKAKQPQTRLKSTCFTVIFLLVCAGFQLAAASAQLGQEIFRSNEPMTTIITVAEKGWYSIAAHSPTGTRLQLIDRMAGILAAAGSQGRADGRINRLLEAGEYKLLLEPDDTPGNIINLSVEPFTELNGPQPAALPFLQEGDFVTTDLEDLQLRSYWLRIEENSPLHLEVLARSISDCQLWRDGEWLEPVTPYKSAYAPLAGRTMTYFEYHHTLPAGLYLLQCTGGQAAEWSNGATDNPLYLRRGATDLGRANYLDMEISPFGRDGYWVSGDSDFFQVTREKKAETRLQLARYYPDRRRLYNYEEASITENQKEDPLCSLSRSYGGERQWLIVSGKPGDRLKLRFFTQQENFRFGSTEHSGEYWVSSLSSAESRYAPDLTPLLIRQEAGGYVVSYGQPLTAGPGQPVHRRINLLNDAGLFVYIAAAGEYLFREAAAETGAAARYRFSLLDDSEAYKNAEYRQPEESQLLAAGYYLLEIAALKYGVLDFALFAKQDAGRMAEFRSGSAGIPQQDFTWQQLAINPAAETYLYLQLNPRFQIAAGLTIRKLPLDLGEPLAFYLEADKSAVIPFLVEKPCSLQIRGGEFRLAAGNTAPDPGRQMAPGAYTLVFHNPGSSGSYYSLATRQGQPAPPLLPDMPAAAEMYPLLDTGSSLFADYARNQTRQYLVQVTEPAFYRLETTGRLAMSLNVRTRAEPRLFSARANGTGRNALVAAYLKPGDYLVEAAATGASRGRAGLTLIKTPLTTGGVLVPGAIHRHVLAADAALSFTLEAQTTGRYKLQTYGLGLAFDYRLEDADGWPLVTTASGGLEQELPKGTYTYYSLPKAFQSRRLTVLTAPAAGETVLPDNSLIINSSRKAVWQEKPGRPPERYTLAVPADLKLELRLSRGMEAEITDPAGNSFGRLSGDNPVVMELAAGAYILDVRCSEENNNFPYTISLATDQLAPGLSRQVTAFPAVISLSCREQRIINLWSFGTTDVRASLWDSTGTVLLAENDDLAADWNFKISRKLEPGRYRLQVERSGSRGSTTVFMEEMAELTLPTRSLPFSHSARLAGQVLRIPFTTGYNPGLYSFIPESRAKVFLELYRENRLINGAAGPLYIPLEGKSVYTLHIWHEETGPADLKISAGIVAALAYDFTGRKDKLSVNGAVLLNNRPGLSFTLGGDTRQLLFSPAVETPCLPVSYLPMNTQAGRGWIINPISGSTAAAEIIPLSLAAGQRTAFTLDAAGQAFTLSHYASGILVLQARSPGNQVGVTITAEQDYFAGSCDWNTLLLTEGGSLAGIPGKGEFRGRVWNIAPDAGPIPVTLAVDSYNLQAKTALAAGTPVQIMIEPGAGCVFTLPAGRQQLNLLLARELLAFAWEGGVQQAMARAEQGNTACPLTVTGGSLAVVNTGKKAALARITAEPAAEAAVKEITGSRGFEAVLAEAASLRFRVTPGRGKDLLCVSGGSFSAFFGGDDGRIYPPQLLREPLPAEAFPLKAGLLEIRCQPGLLKIWQTTAAGRLADYIGFTGSLPGRDLTPAAGLSQQAQLWTFVINEPGCIRLQAAAPGLTALYDGSKLLAAAASGSSRQLFHYLSRGAYRVFTRPVGEARQAGFLEFERITPVRLTPAEENSQRIIGPGEYHVYAFTVMSAGKIGVGLRAEQDGLEGRLYDDSFTELGAGPLQLPELKAGEYFLVVHCPAGTIQYSPQLRGTAGSLTEIPYEVIKQYQIQASTR